MMNKRRLSIAPLSSPTLDGMELQDRQELQKSPRTAVAAADTAAAGSGGKLTSIHVTALDGIVSVNSLFTMAIFIGMSLTVPEKATAVESVECTAGPGTVRRLIVFEVLSFSFFLFSSLIAQSLKLLINLVNNMDAADPHKADVNAAHFKYCLFLSAVGSVLGCTFLTMSVVDFVRVKLGSLTCGGEPVYAVVTLVVFVGSGLLVYSVTAIYAVFFARGESDKYEAAAAAAAASSSD